MEGNFKKWINRINCKQDVLTENNVGQFMDLKLSTKSTPTSGDTVLARDILTNKAVEIPIESFATQQALNNKLDKGTYTGNASDLFLNDQNLENSKQKKVTVITITGNTTLSEIHNGAILHVTNTCNITIPTGLDANFQCVVYAKGSIIVTFVNGGVTLNSPSGLLLKTDKMASLFANASNTFNLLGELATS